MLLAEVDRVSTSRARDGKVLWLFWSVRPGAMSLRLLSLSGRARARSGSDPGTSREQHLSILPFHPLAFAFFSDLLGSYGSTVCLQNTSSGDSPRTYCFKGHAYEGADRPDDEKERKCTYNNNCLLLR